jgi:hypothetical protein
VPLLTRIKPGGAHDRTGQQGRSVGGCFRRHAGSTAHPHHRPG